MLSSNSTTWNLLDPIPNYKLFPENDTSYIASSNFFPNSPHIHLEYQDVYRQFLELFYQHHPLTPDAAEAPPPKMAADSNENVVVVIKEDGGKTKADDDHQPIISTSSVVRTNVRSCKKDRHSKINTARGPRDRRMRLSLDIARKFFDLQDLLGYDKASRTVEWLLRNSGPAITELARCRGLTVNNNNNNHGNNPSSESSTCEGECEVVSSMEPSKDCSSKSRMRREKVKRLVGRATVARESRRKARERARERTSQKRRLNNQSSEEQQKISCGESGGGFSSHSFKESPHVPMYDMQQQIAQVEDLVCTAPWNASTVFNYQEDDGVFLNQDEQIGEFQFSGKPWEAFNSFNLSG